MKMGRELKMILSAIGLLAALCAVGFVTQPRAAEPAPAETPPAWALQLQDKIKTIDAETPGNLGVFVKKLGTPEEMNYLADRDWYLASTVKVPVAIAVLQLVEEGGLSLDRQIAIKAGDPVDGSGEVQFKRPGTKVRVSYLIEKMLTQSDSTATDILIRLIGVEELNERIRAKMGVEGFQPFTTILQVRRDAFGNLHPNARDLTNRHFIDLKKHKSSSAKLRAIAKQLRVPLRALKEKSIEDAFERYYEKRLNSGTLRSFGFLLEKLARGELLSKPHTDLVLSHMTAMTTGEKRVKAGLPNGVRFAQKTGTQLGRICNVGIVYASTPLVIATCLEKFGSLSQGEKALQKVGQALAAAL